MNTAYPLMNVVRSPLNAFCEKVILKFNFNKNWSIEIVNIEYILIQYFTSVKNEKFWLSSDPSSYLAII